MSEEERKTFITYRIDQFTSQWLRMKWIKELERKYNLEKENRVPINTIQLYHQATLSYVNELYFASLLAIGSAIESFLSYKIDNNYYKERKFLSDAILKAFEIKLIQEDMKEELRIFNSSIRNNIVHVKGVLGLDFLGFNFDAKTNSFSSANGNAISINPKERCEESIDLFLRLVKEILSH